MYSMANPDHPLCEGPGGAEVSRSLPSYHSLRHTAFHYEKDFNIRLTRIQNSSRREDRNSMLWYSENMRAVSERRHQVAGLGGDDRRHLGGLQVRAQRIPRSRLLPKLSSVPPKTSPSKTPPSVDKLSRSYSTGSSPLDKPEVQASTSHKAHLRLSLATAADLQEILDSSENSKSSVCEAWQAQPGNVTKSLCVTLPKIGQSSDTSVKKEEELTESHDANSNSYCDTASNVEDTPSLTDEETSAKKEREAVTKQLLRSAIIKLKEIEAKKKDPQKIVPKLTKSKRMKIPKGMDSIPEVEGENCFEQDSRPPSKSTLRMRHSHSPISVSRDKPRHMVTSPLDTIDECDKNHSPFDNSDDEKSDDEKKSDQVKLPPITIKHKSDYSRHWRVVAASDPLTSRRLQYRAKQKCRPSRMRYLKNSNYYLPQ